MKENEVIERIIDFKKFADLVGSPDEFFQHMQGHTKELSLILCVFDVAENVDLIINALEERQNNKWIPVSERLPDEELEEAKTLRGSEAVYPVMVTVKKRKVSGDYINVVDKAFYGELYGNKIFFDKDANGINVVAWKPLPEPYKESDI